jgi:hypothetical protein
MCCRVSSASDSLVMYSTVQKAGKGWYSEFNCLCENIFHSPVVCSSLLDATLRVNIWD